DRERAERGGETVNQLAELAVGDRDRQGPPLPVRDHGGLVRMPPHRHQQFVEPGNVPPPAEAAIALRVGDLYRPLPLRRGGFHRSSDRHTDRLAIYSLSRKSYVHYYWPDRAGSAIPAARHDVGSRHGPGCGHNRDGSGLASGVPSYRARGPADRGR